MSELAVPVNISAVRRRVGNQEALTRSVTLGDLSTSAASLDPEVPVQADLLLESYPEGIVATGTVSVEWIGDCRRCLEPATGRVTAPVRELFSDEIHRDRSGADIGEQADVEAYPIDGDWIDLGPLLSDAAVLALPLAPLCSDDCRGPQPGDFPVHTDEQPLEKPADPRWDALSELRFDAE